MNPTKTQNIKWLIEDEIVFCRENQIQPVSVVFKPQHSKTCAITKVGTDDPDCTCGLQEVLDDEARDLCEEAELPEEENLSEQIEQTEQENQ